MARLSREVLKERLNQAIFDALDELEAEVDLDVEKEAEFLTDAVFNVLSEADGEELDPYHDDLTGDDDTPVSDEDSGITS